MRRRKFVELSGAMAMLVFAAPPPWPLTNNVRAADDNAIPVVVAEFDYNDTSGEVEDQRAEHAARMKAFAGLLREFLAASGRYKVLRLDCASAICSARNIGADDLVAAARKAAARLLVCGSIHKMSTLIEWGSVQVIDVQEGQLLLDRLFSFRGDNDEAFRRAAEFIGNTLQSIVPKS